MVTPIEHIALPPFPRAAAIPESRALEAAGIRLRPASISDLALLRQLHATSRMPELLLAPWTAAEKQAFLDEQFRLQHCHFVRHFAQADFWVIEKAARPIGRLYLDRAGTDWRLIDILLAADARSNGIGQLLLDWIQREAEAAGATITLHVAANNPRAHALYLRMGFAEVEGGDGLHQRMRWTPGP
jgi:GNAT superfamily N-acetyltransferase